MPKTIALGLTHPGTVRNRNENAFYLLDTLVPGAPDGPAAHAIHAGQPTQFYAVAAGIGGHGIGDVAARTALLELESASRRVLNPARFDFFAFGQSWLQQADRAVHKALKDRTGGLAGTSLAMLCLAGDRAYVLSSGDCRVYRLRRGEMIQLTEDDVRSIDPPHRLTRFIGQLGEENPEDPPRLRQFMLESEDVFLLTTHGLTDRISDEALAERLNAPEIFTAKPEHLLRQALAGDARDNLSLVLLRVLDLVSSETAPALGLSHPRHRTRPALKINSYFLRAALVLLGSITLGFVAGWVLLTMFF